MYLDYPLLSLIFSGCWMAVLAGVFLAFGWCDPREYQRKIGLDIFSGVMAFAALRVGSHIKDVAYATVSPRTDGKLFNLDAILQFATGYYDQLNFNSVFDKVDNQLLALIVIGIGIMFVGIISIISVVFGIYFVFRMCVLLDLYINNIIRFVIMGVFLVVTLIVGMNLHQTSLMMITLLIGIVSIIKLAIGHVLLYYYGEEKQPKPAHAKAGAPARRSSGGSRPAAKAPAQPTRSRPQQAAGRPAGGRPAAPQAGNRAPSAARLSADERPRPQVRPTLEDYPFSATIRDMSDIRMPKPGTRQPQKPAAPQGDKEDN